MQEIKDRDNYQPEKQNMKTETCDHEFIDQYDKQFHRVVHHCIKCGKDFITVFHPFPVKPGCGKQHMSKKERLKLRREKENENGDDK